MKNITISGDTEAVAKFHEMLAALVAEHEAALKIDTMALQIFVPEWEKARADVEAARAGKAKR